MNNEESVLTASDPRTTLVAVGLAIIFGAIAVLHFYWAIRGVTGGSAALPMRANGTPLFLPTRASTMLVVLALLGAIAVILGRANVFQSNSFFASIWKLGVWVLGCVFLLRAIGDFRFAGLFKNVRTTEFAIADTRYYTPLCVLIAAGVFYVAIKNGTADK